MARIWNQRDLHNIVCRWDAPPGYFASTDYDRDGAWIGVHQECQCEQVRYWSRQEPLAHVLTILDVLAINLDIEHTGEAMKNHISIRKARRRFRVAMMREEVEQNLRLRERTGDGCAWGAGREP